MKFDLTGSTLLHDCEVGKGFSPARFDARRDGSMTLYEHVFVWCLIFRGQMMAVFLDLSCRNVPLELTGDKHLILIFSILSLDYEGNDSPFLVKCNTLNFPDHTIYSSGGSCGIQN